MNMIRRMSITNKSDTLIISHNIFDVFVDDSTARRILTEAVRFSNIAIEMSIYEIKTWLKLVDQEKESIFGNKNLTKIVI